MNEVKIDKSFVMDLGQAGNRAIVESVIGLGRAFNIRVVAEGVEDRATLDAIRALSCPVAQGYYYSVPLAAADFSEWIRMYSGRLTARNST